MSNILAVSPMTEEERIQGLFFPPSSTLLVTALLLMVTGLVVPQALHAQDVFESNYSNCSGSANSDNLVEWTNDTCWTLVTDDGSDGTESTGYPNDDNDNVTIQSEDLFQLENSNPSLGGSLTIGDLTIKAGNSGPGASETFLILDDVDLTVSGNVSVESVTEFYLEQVTFNNTYNGGNLTVSGDLTNSGKINTSAGTSEGIVILSGSSPTIDYTSATTTSIERLETSASDPTVTLLSDLDVTTLDAASNFTLKDGTTSGQQRLTTGGTIGSKLTVLDDNDGADLTLSSGLTIKGDFEAQTGTTTRFTEQTVTFDSGNTQTLTGDIGVGSIVVDGGTTLQAGSVEFGLVDVGGSFTINNGSLSFGGSTVRFNGSSDQSVSAGGATFGGITVNNSGNTITLDGTPVSATGKVEIASGTLALDSGGARLELTSGNDLVVNDSFSPNSQKVLFSGGSNQQIRGSASSVSFQDLEAIGSKTLTFDNTTNVAGNLTLGSNTQATVADPLDIEGNFSFEDNVTLQNSLNVAGDLTANGDLDAISNNETVTLDASSGTQTIGGSDDPMQFHVLDINSSGVDLCSSCGDGTKTILIENEGSSPGARLVLSSGTFDVSNGELLLASGEGSGTLGGGSFSKIEYQGGSLNGTAIAQLDLDGVEGWRMLTPQVGGGSETIRGLLETQDGPDQTNDLFTQCFTGADNDTGKCGDPDVGPNVLVYDDGYVAASSETATIERGQGYFVKVFNDEDNDGANDGFPKLIDAKGSVYDNTSFDFTGLSSPAWNGSAGTFNLVANPYAAPLDWSNDSGWDRTGINDPIYIWDVDQSGSDPTGDWVTSIGDNTFSDIDGNIIAPFQAFFVEADGGGDFRVSDVTTAQASSDGTFYKSRSTSGPGGFTFQLDLDTLSTDTDVIWWKNKGKLGKDAYDALQLGSFSKQYQIRTYSLNPKNGTSFDINTLPKSLTDTVEVPIAAEAKGCVDGSNLSGTATLSWPTTKDLPGDWKFQIIDNEKTDTTIDPRSQDSYSFQLSSNCTKSTTRSKAKSSVAASLPPPPEPIRDGASASAAKSASASADPSTRFTLRIIPAEALPVELNDVSGEVEGQDAILTWQTASETNNLGFQVQHKTDGAYTDLEGAFVESKAQGGTTDQPQSYRYRVANLDAGEHTFRLKQVDTDGTASFSDPIPVGVGVSGAYNFTTYPNPVRERATVKFALKEKKEVTIALYNTLGQRVKTIYRDTPPAEQTKQIALDTDGLSSGLYILRLKGDGVTATQRVTVVK